MNPIEAFNQTLFLHMNGTGTTPVWLMRTAMGVADYLIALIPLLLLGLWLWGDHARRRVAVKACLVAMLSLATNQAIGALWPHPRPFMIGLGQTWIPHAADPSFPSDHMTVFCSIGLTLLFDGVVAWGVATLLVGLAVAWARVFLGVHFPLDMVGAVVAATVVYVIVTPSWRRLGGPITGALERIYRRVFWRAIAAEWVRQ
ncbi:MAG: hypothetical protein RLZZ598_1655 [Pseudomonadota bacterium]|jgi:undecaprenyl-diphosphatase